MNFRSLLVSVALVVSCAILPQPASAFDWAGFYAGVYGAGTAGVVTDVYDDIDTFDFLIGGGQIGGRVGADMQTGNAVFGVFVDASVAKITGTGSCFSPDCMGSGTEPTVTVDSLASLNVRGGYAVDRTLFYATAGLGLAHASGSDPVQAGSDVQTHVGALLGGGVEYAISDTVSVFGEASVGWYQPIEYALVSTPDRIGFSLGTVKVGAIAHF